MRKASGLVAFLLLSVPAAAEPFHHPFGEWREYHRDWLAACPDNIVEGSPDFYGYSCFASTGSQEVNGANLPAYTLTLIRNRLDGTLDLAITVAPDKGEYDASRPITLQFSGQQPVALAMGTDIETRFNTVNQFFIVDPDRLAGLIDTMTERNAVTLSVPLVGQEQPVSTWLSLRGVLASLDFMDTYSRRVAQY